MNGEDSQSFAEAAEDCIRDSARVVDDRPQDRNLAALVTALNGITYALLAVAEAAEGTDYEVETEE